MSKPDQNHLWTRKGGHFEVEIKIGRAWVQAGTSELESEARRIAVDSLSDPAVLSVRILEHDITHTCTIFDQTDNVPAVSIPRTMKPTGTERPCPKCGEPAVEADDTNDLWLLCGYCGQAFPG